MKQLRSDIYAQNWDALYGMADSEDRSNTLMRLLCGCWSCTRRFADM
jgi:hypothetical protein